MPSNYDIVLVVDGDVKVYWSLLLLWLFFSTQILFVC
jgi:hypothetical protein